MAEKEITKFEKVVNLAKRRGFVFPSSEIYGGFAGFYDYGPVGAEMINNIKKEWWKEIVHDNLDIVGINGTIITHPKVWEASGHVTGFIEYLIECKKCKESFRADHLIEDTLKIRTDSLKDKEFAKIIKENNLKCPKCKGELGEIKEYNSMFTTQVGLGEKSIRSFLRPETAQLIYLNFKNVLDTSRQKIPFGIAQIGKAFRNEISPRDFLFRMREFEQMEMQYFVREKDSGKFFEKWQKKRMEWYLKLGIKKENIRFREHNKNELAHYAKKAIDIEYNFDFGWKEIEGIHNRGDWDLSQHEKFSKKNLKYSDEETKEKFIPWIIETSAGVDRAFLIFLVDAYHEEEIKGEKRIVLKLNPKIAAYKVAVFPLVSKNGLPKKSREVYENLRTSFPCFYDEKGSIGRRYRRMDEIGTPFCVTIDHQTLEDDTVTIRDRDSTDQIRVKIDELIKVLNKKINL
jgi:glycyl-tRNA synthetase